MFNLEKQGVSRQTATIRVNQCQRALDNVRKTMTELEAEKEAFRRECGKIQDLKRKIARRDDILSKRKEFLAAFDTPKARRARIEAFKAKHFVV